MRQFNIETLAAGYEGIMIKDPDAPYETKRTSAWLKIKPVITVDLVIIGMEEGTGKYAGMLGALVCEGEDAGKKIRTNVGSGITDEQRKEMWEKREELIGEIVEIKADTITKDRTDDEFFSLRFPRFERFRGINRGEKM
jgi:DNA ligase-1